MEIKIEDKTLGQGHPTYFIADIASNHDGNLDRAKELVRIAKKAGADAAKFQNFKAATIVSDYGFKSLGSQQSHQASWKKSIYEVYEDYSIALEWTKELRDECKKVGIHYFSSPYNNEAVDFLNDFMPAYKIGSGDITWLEIIERIARKQKPVFLATGASTIGEVQAAVDTILNVNPQLCLMQCNTNYTADPNNFKHIHLNVLNTYKQMYPSILLGLSDHTHGHTTVLGAVALGAVAIEKHFTDDNSRSGPDHKFAMNPETWREMVDKTRELEKALGDGSKKVEENEKDTVVLQRRCLRATRDIKAGETIKESDIFPLRPSPKVAFQPYEKHLIVNKKARTDIPKGDYFSIEKIM